MRRLRSRLLALVLLAVAPAVAAVIYSGLRNQHGAYVRARREAVSLASTVAANYRQTAQDTRNLVDTLSEVPSVRADSGSNCHPFLARVLRRNSMLANIGVIDGRGYLACSAKAFSGSVYLGDRTYFRRAQRQDRSVTGSFQIGRVVHTPMIVFAAPLGGREKFSAAVVYASLRLSWLGRIATNARLPPHSTVTIVDGSGRIIAREPDTGNWLGKRDANLTRLIKEIGSRPKIMKTAAGIDGMRRLFAVSQETALHSAPDPYVLVGIPESDILAPGRQELTINLIMLAVAVTLLLGIGWWASERLILDRVRALVSATERFGAGDRTARTRLKGGDELARLGTAFDHMADTLHRYTQDLETEVERTRRLNRIYQVLSAINGTILRVRDRDALFDEACRVAVDVGGLSMAWIGLTDPDSGRVHLLGHAGPARKLIEGLHVSARDTEPEGGGTVGPALRSRQPVVCNDVAADPRMNPWRDVLLSHACRAVATFPLILQERVIGNFTLYASCQGYFDEQEIRLFEEVAADTALGLELIDTGAQRDYFARHDPATGLPNRRQFLETLSAMERLAEPDAPSAAVLAVEIPEVVALGDRFGRHLADDSIRHAGAGISEDLGDADTIGVLGPYTFGVAVAARNRQEPPAHETALRILDRFPLDLETHNESHVLTARIGVAQPGDAEDTEERVRNAEVAVHSLRESSGETLRFYSPQEDARETRRHRVAQALRRALQNNEFEIVYQPYVDIRSGQPVGAEALLRWHNQDLGFVSPGEFIPIAEETGLVEMIGGWTFRSVLRQVTEWCQQGMSPGTVSVNVSARELQEPDVVAAVERHLARAGVDLSQCAVAIEMTETSVVQDFQRVSSALDRIRALGLKIYLDDFGTGYSSLLYLQKMPLDVLKIDLSFISRIAEDPASLALTRSSISLGHSLGLRVIAEGVETVAQLALLRELGCDIAQGFLFSRPLPLSRFEDFVQRKQQD